MSRKVSNRVQVDDEALRKKFKAFLARKKIDGVKYENKRLAEELENLRFKEDKNLQVVDERTTRVIQLQTERELSNSSLQCYKDIHARIFVENTGV